MSSNYGGTQKQKWFEDKGISRYLTLTFPCSECILYTFWEELQ